MQTLEEAPQSQANSTGFDVTGPVATGMHDKYEYLDLPILGDAAAANMLIATGNLNIRVPLLKLESPGIPAELDLVHNSTGGAAWNDGLGAWGFSATTARISKFASSGGDTSESYSFVDKTGAVFSIRRDSPSSDWQYQNGLEASFEVASDGTYEIVYNSSGETLAFSSGGVLTSHKDRNGLGVTYGYTGTDLTSITNSLGLTIARTSHPSVWNQTWADETGRTVTLTRSGQDLASATIPGKGTMSFRYVGLGATAKISSMGLAGKSLEFRYESSTNGKVKTVLYRNTGFSDVRAYARSMATVGGSPIVTIRDAHDGDTKYKVDNLHRVLEVTDQLGNTREQSWAPNSKVATTTSGVASANSGVTTTAQYDSNNNLTSVTLPTGAAAQAIYTQGPNCTSGQSGNPYLAKCTIDDAGNSQSMTYDAAGNLMTRTNTTSGGAAESFSYTYGSACGGMAGQICTAVDGNGKTTSYTYSGGHLTKVTPPAPLGATTYTYDGIGRLATVTSGAGHKTTYAYDGADRIIQSTYHNNTTLISEYNADGSLKQQVDSATGTTIAYTYDVLGQQTKQTTTSSTAGLNQMATMSYDLVGNLTRVYDSVGAAETSYTYDAANQLIRARLNGGDCDAANSPGCIRWEYDADGLEKARLFPFGARQDTMRDDSGRPTRITTKDKNGAVQTDIAYTYALNGQDSGSVRTRTSHKEQGITAGAVTTYSYDSRRRLTTATEKVGSTTSASWSYQYDKADNRTRQVRAGSTGAAAGTINYTYNNANQLTAATGSTGAWTYDGAGNQTRNALSSVSSTYGDRLQATANGNTSYMTFGQGNSLQLKVGNEVQKYTTLGAYGTASDRTIARNAEGTAIATRVGTTWAFLASDHLGSTTGAFGGDGAYLGGYSYSPYGEARSTSTNATIAGNTIRYIGQHLEPSTGLYKLGARYYDTSLGRFTQMDPSGQERNPYAYAGCNPIGSKDPTGLSATAAFRLIGGFFGLTSTYGALTGDNLAGYAAGAAVGIACGAAVTVGTVATAGAAAILALFCETIGVITTTAVNAAIENYS